MADFSKIKNILSKKNHKKILLIWFFLIILSQFLWLQIDNTPEDIDSLIYRERGIIEYQNFDKLADSFLDVFIGTNYQNNLQGYSPHPIYSFLLSSYFHIFGLNENVSMINSLFIFILIFSTYGLGKYLFDSKTGIFAALIVPLFPFYLLTFRMTLYYTALGSMAILFTYLLFKSENFQKRNYSLLAGVVFGISLLIRELFAVYIIFPLIYSVFNKKFISKKSAINFTIFLLLSIILIFKKYILNIMSFFNFWFNSFNPDNVALSPLDLLKFNFNTLINETASFFILLFIFFSIILIIKKESIKNLIFLLGWFFSVLIIVSILTPGLTYMSVTYTIMALVISAGIFSIKTKKIRFGTITIILIVSSLPLLWFLPLGQSETEMPVRIYRPTVEEGVPRYGRLNPLNMQFFNVGIKPNKKELDLKEIIQYTKGSKVLVDTLNIQDGVTDMYYTFQFNYRSKLQNFDTEFTSLSHLKRESDYEELIKNYDYLVDINSKENNFIYNPIIKSVQDYYLITYFEMPNGQQMRLIKLVW